MSSKGRPAGGSFVVSIGGNALVRRGSTGEIEEQLAETESSCAAIASLLATGARVVITHGNGPVVGNIVLRNEAARNIVPPMPLYICDADSEGGVGFMIQLTLYNSLLKAAGGRKAARREVATVVTQVVVDPADPAFTEPTKPIGPYYTTDEAAELTASKGWTMFEDSGRGMRRVVPSPMPMRVVESGVVRTLSESGVVVIAGGGGGVPVVEAPDGTLSGVDAVIDKDYTTTILALDVGADTIVNLTQVDMVYTGFGTSDEAGVPEMSASDAKKLLRSGEFAPGSMAPKVDAAVRFVEASGGTVIITSPRLMDKALAGRAGTRIFA